jgi:hypothetical protein
MSSLSSFKRRLNPKRVYLAGKVAEEKLRLAKKVVLERVQKDSELAAEVLNVVGDGLPPELKAACEKSVLSANIKKSVENMSLGDGFVAVQSDGGEQLIVPETDLPDYPKDGEKIV